MGLGNTVELISLICLNRQPQPAPPQLEHPACSATLIITPPSILNQWRSEIASHAPSLRVYHYQGLKKEGLNREDDTWRMKNILMNQDVVLTSYNDLAAEFHYVDHKPNRSLRHEKRYIPHKSPLVEMRWWRVCLDEAQMIESGVSNAAKVCSRYVTTQQSVIAPCLTKPQAKIRTEYRGATHGVSLALHFGKTLRTFKDFLCFCSMSHSAKQMCGTA